jgi:flagellar motor switch protein FliN
VAGEDDLLSSDEIEALMKAARGGAPEPQPAAAPAESNSDLLDPAEIEALMRGAASGTPAPTAGGDSDLLSSSDIEALLNQRPQAAPPSKPASPKPERRPPTATEQTLREAESQLAAAMAPSLPNRGIPPELGSPAPFSFQDFGRQGSTANLVPFPIASLQDVELDVRIELGRTELLIDEVVKLREGSVVPLDKLAGDPVDILVNGRLIARGEVLVLNDNFCVRVAEILAP